MLITIPVHPMTRAILLAEYGHPVSLPKHSFLHDLITAPPRGRRGTTSRPARADALSATVTFSVDDKMAPRIAAQAWAIGLRLLRLHKERLCQHAASAARLRGRGHVRPAIEEWLSLHGVTEDDYSLETAYKLWQRFGWNLDKKNRDFSARMVRKTGAILGGKSQYHANFSAASPGLSLRLSEAEIEMCVARFMAGLRLLFRRAPARVEKHARVWLWVQARSLSQRQAAERLGWKRSAVRYACDSICARRRRNPTFARLLDEALSALPQPA